MTLSTRIISNQFPDHFACGQNWKALIQTHVTTLFGDSLRKRVFQKSQKTVMELRALIILASNKITEDMRCRVINITVLVEEVAKSTSDHAERLIHGG
jgi:hypothetical protein